MGIEFLLSRFESYEDRDAIVWCEQVFSYRWLLQRISHWRSVLDTESVRPGTVVAVEADFSPNAIALLIALIERDSILVPLSHTAVANREDLLEISQSELLVCVDQNDEVVFEVRTTQVDHEILVGLKGKNLPGLVLFSSGSTGAPKAAVHDLNQLLEKFKVHRHARRAISFLLFDHIGGVNTLFYQLSNGGCTITLQERDPDTVLEAIEKFQVELLPTSPTFLNLVILSEAYQRHSLDSLELITYGTEPMPESTLVRIHELFPKIQLLQTYGLSEVGILRSKSKSSSSLWMKIGGEGFETRVVDGVLHIRAASSMEGYLNADNPFDPEGWFNTGDEVIVDGDYFRVLGRSSEIINVGGEKVYPAEVESVVQKITNVKDVIAYGAKNSITGQAVCLRVNLSTPEDAREFKKRLKRFCRGELKKYQIPVKVDIVEESLHSGRFKKMRKS